MNDALIPNVPVSVERATQSDALMASIPADMSHVALRQSSALQDKRSARHTGFPGVARLSRRRRGSQGAQLLEFTLNFLPFMIMIIVLVDTAWAIFAQATLQQAVRMAVRAGVTLTTAQVTTNLTDTVKADVQAHAVGLLNGATGKAYIQVHYFDQDNPSVDVSTQASGNRGGNIMRVSVVGYPLVPLMPRFFSWKDTVDKSPMSMTVYAADMIEPIATYLTPAIGPAP
jgi:Flp pilus assembly protein TadG